MRAGADGRRRPRTDRAWLAVVFCAQVIACASATGGSAGGSRLTADEVSDGMTLDTGLYEMGGGSEVTCRMRQDPDDRARLVLTVQAECATVGDLEINVYAGPLIARGVIKRTLAQRAKEQVTDGPSFPLPTEGTLLRTTIAASCVGGHRRISASARCLVPRRQ